MITVCVFSESIEASAVAAAPRVENWAMQNERIVGFVYGHPDIPDGHEIQTSEIVKVCDNLAHTRNSMYRLGEKARF